MRRSKAALSPFTIPPGYEALQPVLQLFAMDHPHFEKNVFIAMRFCSGRPFDELHHSIKTGLADFGLYGLRADDKVYPVDGDLWTNICVYMLACRYAVCVFEEIDDREFNPNVPLEYGFMRALNRPVLLLKDQRMPRLPTDMTGKIYRHFDSYNVTQTVHDQIAAWAQRDLGLQVISKAPKVFELLNDSRIQRTVLILGRFPADRPSVLESLRTELLRYGYEPAAVNLESAAVDLYRSISTLAHLACFIVADLSDARSTMTALQMTVPHLSIPVILLMVHSAPRPLMLEDLTQYPWVLPLCPYRDSSDLQSLLGPMISRAEETIRQLDRSKSLTA